MISDAQAADLAARRDTRQRGSAHSMHTKDMSVGAARCGNCRMDGLTGDAVLDKFRFKRPGKKHVWAGSSVLW